MLVFFSTYADKIHHYKEEEILFPEISKKSEIAGIGIVSELSEHHEEFRLMIQEIRSAMAIQDFESAQHLLESYIHQLRDHIAAENEELFPMAEDIFSKEEMDLLYYKCIDKDQEMGIGQKEEMEDLITKLSRNETVQ